MHNIDSLNVAMAGAIIMYRFKRINEFKIDEDCLLPKEVLEKI